MKSVYSAPIRYIALFLILLLPACTVAGGEEPTETFPPPSLTLNPPTQTRPTSITVAAESSIGATRPGGVALTQTADSIQPVADTPTSTPVTVPSPTRVMTATPSPTMAATSAALQGPLIAYRVQDDDSYLLLFDVGTLAFREIRTDLLVYAFGLEWLDGGCHLYVRGRVIDLQGNVVEEIADWEDENAPFKVMFLSPDRNWGVNELFLGINEEDSAELLSLEILNRAQPGLRTLLAPNRGAYAYAWSPNGDWLAFSDYDENHILQVYRATPDGSTTQQLTSHTQEPGIINLIAWSPDGQNIAYAASTLLPHQFERGDEGWIGLISLSDLRSRQITPSQFAYATGLWWSLDGNRVAFVGESLPTVPQGDLLQGTQMYWADGDSGDILNSFFQAQAPTGFFNLVVPVGDIDTVFFEATDGYYLLDATTNNYEKILDDIETDGLIRDFVTAPFDFPGEANCPDSLP